MAPLNPTANKCYTILYPHENEDDRLNLKVRTGAATCIVYSRIFVHGGLTLGLNLPEISLLNLEDALKQQKEQVQVPGGDKYLSSGLFELNITERRWSLRCSKHQGEKLSTPIGGGEGDVNREEKPKPRIFHTIVCNEDNLYLYGGLVLNSETNRFEPVSDLWMYQLSEDKWTCLYKGNLKNKGRFDHNMVFINSPSSFNKSNHQGLLIVGGKTNADTKVPEFDFFDLTNKEWVGDVKKILPIEELRIRLPNRTEKTQKKVVFTNASDSSFTVHNNHQVDNNNTVSKSSSSARAENIVHSLIAYTKMGPNPHNLSPLIEFPLDSNAVGKRLPVTSDLCTKDLRVPFDLSYMNIGSFGDHLIVMGFAKDEDHISIYLYHKPSGKWTKLKANCDHDLYSHKVTKGYVWASHHRIILLGDAKMHEAAPSTQYFNLLMTVSLPFVNVTGSAAYYSNQPQQQQQQQHSNYQNRPSYYKKSFIEYSRYVAPQVQMTSIKSAFPQYAVTLGKNAFERFGYSIADFEFLSAEGDSVPVPSMLCRKRWGRCFEMLISKGYVRAVDNFEKSTVDNEFFTYTEENKSDTTSISDNDTHATQETQEPQQSQQQQQPRFRIPFQDSSNTEQQQFLKSPATTPTSESSRKLSVASTSSLLESSGITGILKQVQLPPQKQQPLEPAPQLPKQLLKNIHPIRSPSSSSSPRGSISGALQPFSQLEKPNKDSGLSKENNTVPGNVNSGRSRVGSKGSVLFSNNGDDTISTHNTRSSGSTVNNSFTSSKPPSKKFVSQQLQLNSSKMEPLLLPRAIYLPFTTQTVKALLEFLSTGQVGSKWPIVPTTLDIILISKFYELPLLYDLVLEVLYSIIGNKENQIIADANELILQYTEHMAKLGEQLDEANKPKITCLEGFADFLIKFNDGILDTTILKRISKSKYRNESIDGGRRKKSLGSLSSNSSRTKEFSPMPTTLLQQHTVPQPPLASPLQQTSEELQQEEEIEEGDPRFKSDSDTTDIKGKPEDAHNSSDTSSSDGIGVGIGLVSLLLPSLEDPDLQWRDNSTTTASGVSMQRPSESHTNSSGKKHSSSSSSLKAYQFSSNGDTWPTLEELTAVNAPLCTDIILDFIYEIAALAGDMKLVVRAANIFEISHNFEIEKREILKLMGQNLEVPTLTPYPTRLSQQKTRGLFGKFDIASGGLGGSRYEKRGSISSALSNTDSNHSNELATSSSTLLQLNSANPGTGGGGTGTNSNTSRLHSQLSSSSITTSLERVSTLDSSKSLLGSPGFNSNNSSKVMGSSGNVSTLQRNIKKSSDGNISPTLTNESVNSDDLKSGLKGSLKFTGFLKRKQ